MPPTCVACQKLHTESAALLAEYSASLDALLATPRGDRMYADRWTALSNVSERLYAAQRLELIHHDSHQRP